MSVAFLEFPPHTRDIGVSIWSRDQALQGGTKVKFPTGPGGPVKVFFTGPLKIFTGPPFLNKLSKLYSVMLLRKFQWHHEKRIHF
jgi:hypothetical protein